MRNPHQFYHQNLKKQDSAVTRIRTWVASATTKSTNHYTITAIEPLLGERRKNFLEYCFLKTRKQNIFWLKRIFTTFIKNICMCVYICSNIRNSMAEFLIDNVHLCASSSQQQCEDNLSFQDKTLGIQNIRKDVNFSPRVTKRISTPMTFLSTYFNLWLF